MLKISRSSLTEAKRGGPTSYVEADVIALPFARDTFDWILCTRVFSHVADIRSAALELERVLTVGGECLITDVHPNHFYEHVTIPHNGKKVSIETHKHSLAKLRSLWSTTTLHIDALNEYRLEDLSENPRKENFSKLYQHPDRPIFYVSKLVKKRHP